MTKLTTLTTIKADAQRRRKSRQKIKQTKKVIQRSVWTINEL